MACQQPNNIENSPRIKKWGAQLAKHSAFFSVKSLLFTTALFIAAGYALVSYLIERVLDQAGANIIAIIQMGNAGLIFITFYFVIVEYLFRSRPPEIRLIQRFIWYCAILFIVSAVGLGVAMLSR